MKLSGTTSEELRRDCMTRYFVPIAEKIFDMEPDAQSVVFSVAQYWNDEADDAVHDLMVVSSNRSPRWPECLTQVHNTFLEGDDPDEGRSAEIVEEARRGVASAVGEAAFYLDENEDLIAAFASYCLDGSSQEDAAKDAYLPYAIARRAPNGVQIEVVGEMLRPEWENRFGPGKWTRISS